MKYLTKILSIVFILIAAFQPIHAQSDIDNNRMNRDINIMENVLEELFKTNWSAKGNTVRVRSGGFSFGESREINGTFLPGFGIIFTIEGGSPGFVMVSSDSDDEEKSFTFEYGSDSNGEKITKESITNKIVEFLRDYGSTIGQLDESQKVMVIFRPNNSTRHFTVFSSSDNRKEAKRQQLPTISVVATGVDLQTHRSGDISDNEFRDRLEINSVPADAEPQKDMRVMASILETAFEDSDEESFEIRSSVDHLLLDNFGALFSFEARYGGSRSPFYFSDLHESMEVLKENLSETRAEMEEVRDKIQRDAEVTIDSIRSEQKKEVEENRAQQKKQVLDAYDQFVTDLKDSIVDYGRTLRSVDSDQQILVSVTLDTRYDEIPQRIDLQVQKSVLEDMNPDQAMNEINVREY